MRRSTTGSARPGPVGHRGSRRRAGLNRGDRAPDAAEAAQDNYSKSERLAKQIQEKMAELDARLASAKKDDGEVVARYEAAAKKITKAAGEFESAVARAADAARFVPELPRHIPEVPPVLAGSSR